MTRATPVVADASAVVAMLLDGGGDGAWAGAQLGRGPILAPHLMPAEVADTLRRSVRTGATSRDAASLALADLMDLRIELFPFPPFARRAWELRDHVRTYDAWYVAVAETLDAPLITLDLRLANAHGLRCAVRTPTTR
jgi:predicted nucleic acid-binding protein